MAEKKGKGSTRETEGNVDQIREILFGGQLRDFDRRFSDLEDKLRRDLERARTDLLKRGDNLETLIRDQTEALNQQIKRLEGDFRKHQGTTADQLKRLDDAIRAELDTLFLIGAVSSGVANAISQVAQNYGVIYLNTNSSSPTESGENCHRVKFVFDGHGGNFAKATTLNAIDTYGDNWLLLTNDYVWGHETSASTRALAEANGVTPDQVIRELLALVPVG